MHKKWKGLICVLCGCLFSPKFFWLSSGLFLLVNLKTMEEHANNVYLHAECVINLSQVADDTNATKKNSLTFYGYSSGTPL